MLLPSAQGGWHAWRMAFLADEVLGGWHATSLVEVEATFGNQYRRASRIGFPLGSPKWKRIWIPTQPGNASSFANYTNYSRVLNGIIVDVNNLPAATTDSKNDSNWDKVDAYFKGFWENGI